MTFAACGGHRKVVSLTKTGLFRLPDCGEGNVDAQPSNRILDSLPALRRTLCEASLPEVYAALMADIVESFPAIRPHQRHAWHAFLVQLARWPCTATGWTPRQRVPTNGAGSSAL